MYNSAWLAGASFFLGLSNLVCKTSFSNILIAGVYILSRNFIIDPKHNKRAMKFFIIAPNLHVVRNEIS